MPVPAFAFGSGSSGTASGMPAGFGFGDGCALVAGLEPVVNNSPVALVASAGGATEGPSAAAEVRALTEGVGATEGGGDTRALDGTD